MRTYKCIYKSKLPFYQTFLWSQRSHWTWFILFCCRFYINVHTVTHVIPISAGTVTFTSFISYSCAVVRVCAWIELFSLFFSYANYRDYINQMEVSKITLLWAYHNNISAAHTAKNTRTTSKEKRPIWNIKTTHGNIKFVRWVFRMWECRSYYRQAHFWIFSVWLLLLLLVWRCWSSLSTITSIKWYDKTIPTEVPEERKLRMY